MNQENFELNPIPSERLSEKKHEEALELQKQADELRQEIYALEQQVFEADQAHNLDQLNELAEAREDKMKLFREIEEKAQDTFEAWFAEAQKELEELEK